MPGKLCAVILCLVLTGCGVSAPPVFKALRYKCPETLAPRPELLDAEPETLAQIKLQNRLLKLYIDTRDKAWESCP